MTKRYFRELQSKLTKIVVVFAVTSVPYGCFAISLQTKILSIFIHLKTKTAQICEASKRAFHSIPPVLTVSHMINIFAIYLILFHFSRLPGQTTPQFFALSALNIRPWNVESLESTKNSPLALEQGVARATVQMNRRMREREQRELEREQLQTNQDRRETEIRMRRNREMIERERREIRRSRREWQETGE